MTARIMMPIAEWPERDRTAWMAATGPSQSLFDASAASARLRSRSVLAYEEAFASWLGFLDRHGWLEPGDPVTKAITPERLDLYIAEQRTRGNGNTTIKNRLVGLHAALRLMAPQADLDYIRRPGGIALDRALPSTPKRVAVRDFRELLDRVLQLYQAGITERSCVRGKMAIRDAAIIGLLTLRAPRAGSLVAIEIGTHLTRHAEGYWLWLGEDVMKTPSSLSYPLDDVLTPILDSYLDDVRSSFGGAATAKLWLGSTGAALCAASIGHIVRRWTKVWFGAAKGPHWFRKCLTTTVATESPELARDTATLLGHGMEVGLRNYNMACAVTALRRHGKHVSARRRAMAGLASRAFGNEEPK